MRLPADHPLAWGLPPDHAVAWGEDRFGIYADFAVGVAVQRMRWIPPGRFVMGSPANETGRLDIEGPQHEVTLTRGFWLGDTPVTQALYEAVAHANPSRFKSPDRPVERVSWEECQAFCARLNERPSGFDARLPTDAEWEYACRAGAG